MSIFTLNAYLNDGFTTGGTRFYMKYKENAKVYNNTECGPFTHVVDSGKDSALIFNHYNIEYLHDGEPLVVSDKILFDKNETIQWILFRFCCNETVFK